MEDKLLGKTILVNHPTEEHLFIQGKECKVVGLDLSNQKYIVRTPVEAQAGAPIIARLDREEFDAED